MIGSVDISEFEKDEVIPFLKSKLDKNKEKTIEVPVNLLFVISHFLQASSWYSDMNTSTVPYPSFENVSSQLSYFLKDIVDENIKTKVGEIKRYGAEEYTIYKMLKECNYDDQKLKDLLKGIFEYENEAEPK